MAPMPRMLWRKRGRKKIPENIPTVVTMIVRLASVKLGYLKTRRSRSGLSEVSST